MKHCGRRKTSQLENVFHGFVKSSGEVNDFTREQRGAMPQATSQIGNSQSFRLSTVSIAILVSLFNFGVCYFRSFVFPNIPQLPFGDAVGFLINGSRIVEGRLPYRDYFQFLSPGTEVTYAVLIRGFGARAWIPNLMIAGLAAATAMLMTFAAARLMRGTVVALPGLLLAGLVLPGSLDATHHWFSTVAIMAAMLVLLGGDTFRHIALVGVLSGIAGWYTQSKGATAAAGFMAYLILKGWRAGAPVHDRWLKCVILSGLALAVFLAGNAYFIRTAGLNRWLYCLVVYPLRYYPSVDINNWHVYGDGFWAPGLGKTIPFLFVHATVPLVYAVCIVVIVRWSRSEPHPDWDKIILLSLTGIAMFVAVAAAPGWKRLSTVSPPAMILLTWLLDRSGAVVARFRVGLGTAAVMLALAAAVRGQTRWSAFLNLPVGKTAFTEAARYDEYRYALAHTERGEFMFGPPPVLFALAVKNPAPIDNFVPFEYTRPEQVAETVRALEKYEVPWLMLNPGMFTWPKSNPASDHLDPIRAYLTQHYHRRVAFQTGDELWERTAGSARGFEWRREASSVWR